MKTQKPHLRQVLYFALGFILMAAFMEGWPEIKQGLWDGFNIQ